jgi:hypothetical protein
MRQSTIRARLISGYGITGLSDGVWFTLWALYLTAIQGIPAPTMGLGMGIGSMLGLWAATPIGALADRHGPRGILALLYLARTASLITFAWVTTFPTLIGAAALLVGAQSAAAGVRTTLIYRLIDHTACLDVLARSRVVQHIAYAAGAGLGALALAEGTRTAYIVSIAGSAVAMLLGGIITLLVPAVRPSPGAHQVSLTRAARDIPYLAVMVASAPLILCWAVLSTGVPLWVHGHTHAPLWTPGFAVAVSSLGIAVLQVRVTRAVRTTINAVRATRWSGLALAAACLLFAAGAWPHSPLLAFLVLTVGMAAHICGELLCVASRWTLSLRLMNPASEGQYQGLAATTEAAISAAGPPIITGLLTAGAAAGWVVLAAIILLPVLPIARLVHTCLRTRIAHPAAHHAPTQN